MLKFPVQTFYQSLLSIFPSAIFPLAFSLQQFFPFSFSIFPSTILFPYAIFPFNNSFPFQKLPTPKAQRKAPIIKGKSQKPLFLLHGSFIAANKVEPLGGA
jgi:hypothetical protein